MSSKQEQLNEEILARNAEFAANSARKAKTSSVQKNTSTPGKKPSKNLFEEKKPSRAALAKSPAQSTRSGKAPPKAKKTPSKKRPLDTSRSTKSEPKAKRKKRAVSDDSIQSVSRGRRKSEPYQVDSDDDENSELTDLEVLGVDDEHNEPGPGEMVERQENRDIPSYVYFSV